MKIIDFHQHLWIADDGCGAHPDPDGEEMLRAMDRHGVEWVVLHAVPTSAAPQCGDNEAVLRAMRKHPDRFIGSVYICPKDIVGARDALTRYHGEGFRCVKILPYINAVYLDDPLNTPVFEKINELRLPVMIHMGPLRSQLSNTHLADSRCNHPIYLTSVACRFPNTKFVIAHMAGGWFWDALMLQCAHENVYLETACCGSVAPDFLRDYEQRQRNDHPEYLRVFRLDNHVMFGLDLGPVNYAKQIAFWKRFVEDVGKPQYLENFFYKNAAHVLGLK